MEVLYKSDKKQCPVEVKVHSEEGLCDLSINVCFAKIYMEKGREFAIKSAVKDLRDLSAELLLAAAILERKAEEK